MPRAPLTRQSRDDESFVPRVSEEILQTQIQEVVCYIWDNYLQISESAEHIFVLGAGNAYLGVKVLLVNRGTYFFVIMLCRTNTNGPRLQIPH